MNAEGANGIVFGRDARARRKLIRRRKGMSGTETSGQQQAEYSCDLVVRAVAGAVSVSRRNRVLWRDRFVAR